MTASLIALDRVALIARRSGDTAVEAAVTYARATLEEATERTRRLMFELRPALLFDHGLAPALRLLADQTAREVGAQAEVRGDVGRHEYAIEELVYRSAQEALANVRRHAHPRQITVTLNDEGGTLTVDIEDDGQGFDVADVRSRPAAALHLGLDTLVERMRAAGGHAHITSGPGEGTRVSIAAPAASTPAGPGRPSPWAGTRAIATDLRSP
jgi:signal transduction histidine kinase